MADPSNTARNFILIGALLGVGAAAAGFYIMNSAKLPVLNTSVRPGNEAKTYEKYTKDAIALKDSAQAARELVDVAPEGAVIPRISAPNGSEPRYTPLFFAPKLWQVTTASGRRDIRDLMSPTSKDVHESVKNTEFFKYGLEDIIGRADALDLDPDGDGFTNREEFAAKTNPNDKTSMPPFLLQDSVKMMWTRRSEEKHALSLALSYNFSDDIVVNVYNVAGSDMQRYDKWDLKEGESFGFDRNAEKGALAKNRFKLVSRGKDDEGKYIEIEDSYAIADAEKRFKLYPGERKKHDVQDVSVQLIMTAGPEKDKPVKDGIRLGETFDVPGFPGVQCTLTKAKPKTVTITVTGSEQPIKLEKWTSPTKNKR